MEDWTPMREGEIESIVDSEAKKLNTDESIFFEKGKVLPYKRYFIERGNQVDSVFLIFSFKGKGIFYDDLENEFAIFELRDSAEIVSPNFIGNLQQTLNAFHQ
jgi:hypothetical protein